MRRYDDSTMTPIVEFALGNKTGRSSFACSHHSLLVVVMVGSGLVCCQGWLSFSVGGYEVIGCEQAYSAHQIQSCWGLAIQVGFHIKNTPQEESW